MPENELSLLGRLVDEMQGLRKDFRDQSDKADHRHEDNERWHTEASVSIAGLVSEQNRRAIDDAKRDGWYRLVAGFLFTCGTAVASFVGGMYLKIHDLEAAIQLLQGKK
jgi:hypothetical protein